MERGGGPPPLPCPPPPKILGQLDFYLQGACAVFFFGGWGLEVKKPPYLLFWLLVIRPQVVVKAPWSIS